MKILAMQSINDLQLNIFMSLFKGRSDVYAKRWQKANKSGYMPAYSFSWNDYLRHKAGGGTFRDFEPKTRLPLDRKAVRAHIEGRHFIGIYPLLQDNTSFFTAIDFDRKKWMEDAGNFLKLCHAMHIPAYIEKSLSGKGAHIWIFFEENYPAARSRRVFLGMVRKALKLSEFSQEVSFDRIFPNQDCHSGKGLGNLIALPLNGAYAKNGRTVFVDPIDFTAYPDQWEHLSRIKKLPASQLDKLYSKMGSGIISERGRKTKGRELEIILEKHIVLKKQQVGQALADFLKKELKFINSEYIIRQKIGRSVYGIEKIFNLIGESKHTVMLPRGFLGHLEAFLRQKKIGYRIIDKRPCLQDIGLESRIKLRRPQIEAIQSCQDAPSGVIVAPPGFGKTIVGLELIARKSKPALIILHRRQIYEQWIEKIGDFLGIAKKDIGQICANKKKVSEIITVAMIQSLVKFKGLKEISESFGTIIIDECHHIPAKSFRKAVTSFNPYYIYGLTATPKRKHNDQKMIFLYIGNIICNAAHYMHKSMLPGRENMQLRVRDTDFYVPYDRKTDDFQLLSRILIFDTARNRLIADDIKKELKTGKRILVLTERKEHVEVLNMYLKSQCETITLTGGDSRAAREIKMKQIEAGHFQILITTGQLLGEGLDVRSLSCLFLVFPFAFEGKLIQYMGRILRARGQKKIYDYRDKETAFLLDMYKRREKHYRKLSLL